MDNSFTKQDYHSAESSIVIVRAQEEIREDTSPVKYMLYNDKLQQRKNAGIRQSLNDKFSTADKLLIQSSQIKVESPKKISQIRSLYQAKDYSPSFGGSYQPYKNIYETQDNQKLQPKSSCSTQNDSSKKMYHLKKSSNPHIQNCDKQQFNNLSSLSTQPNCIKPSFVSTVSRDKYVNNKSHLKKKSMNDIIIYDGQSPQKVRMNSTLLCDNRKNNVLLMHNRTQFQLLNSSVNDMQNQSYQKMLNKNSSELINDQIQTLSVLQQQPHQSLEYSTHQNHPTFKVKSLNRSSLNKSQLDITSNKPFDLNKIFNQSTIDIESYYGFRQKNALRRRKQLLEKKQNQQLIRLNDKLAKIEALQYLKEERRNKILYQRDIQKSPCRNQIKYGQPSSTLQANVYNTTVNYNTISQCGRLSSNRTPQPRTPNDLEKVQNDGALMYASILRENRNQSTLNREISNSSKNANNKSSRKINDNSTPKISSRKTYETCLTLESDNQLTDFEQSQSISNHQESRQQSALKTIQPPNNRAINKNNNFSSASNLFKKTFMKSQNEVSEQYDSQHCEKISSHAKQKHSPLNQSVIQKSPNPLSKSSTHHNITLGYKSSKLSKVQSSLNNSHQKLNQKELKQASQTKLNQSTSYAQLNCQQKYFQNQCGQSQHGQKIVERVTKKRRLEPIVEVLHI